MIYVILLNMLMLIAVMELAAIYDAVRGGKTMRRIRMKKSRKYEQDKLQAAINASARRSLDDLEKSSGMLSTVIEALRQGLPDMAGKYRKIAQDYRELQKLEKELQKYEKEGDK